MHGHLTDFRKISFVSEIYCDVLIYSNKRSIWSTFKVANGHLRNESSLQGIVLSSFKNKHYWREVNILWKSVFNEC